jgi:SAM-dependent methyltransferase
MSHATTGRDFFEAKYLQNADPWHFEDSAYEQARYAVVLRAIKRRRYTRAFEPGCSIGVLTESLAHQCVRVEAIDISPTAVARARERCKLWPNVHIQCGSLPEAIPGGAFDLIIFSEIGYYFERRELKQIVQQLSEKLLPGGTLLAVHWLGTSLDHLLSGDEVHEVVRENIHLSLEDAERYERFRLDRMVRR